MLFFFFELMLLTVVLEKTPESPLDCKEIQPVHPKGNQSWIFIGRTDAEAEAPILWPPEAKNWLIGKDLDSGKDWRQEEKGMTEDEMVGWHHWLNGYEFEKALGVGDRQGSLVCFSPFGCKELDMTEQLNGLTGANNRSCRCLWSNNEVQSSFTLELLVWKLYSTPIPLPPFYLENTICLTESKWYLKLCSVCVMQ